MVESLFREPQKGESAEPGFALLFSLAVDGVVENEIVVDVRRCHAATPLDLRKGPMSVGESAVRMDGSDRRNRVP